MTALPDQQPEAPATSRWSHDAAAGIAAQRGAALPRLSPADVTPIVPGHDVWDMWQIARRDGSTVMSEGRSWWFFLATPLLDDPEARHDAARIRLTSVGADGWRDHGWVFEPGFTPGSREWSGSSVLEDDGVTLTMYFTATGRYGAPTTFEQRLFETRGRFAIENGAPVLSDWSPPVELFAADDHWYAHADEVRASPHGIKGFRDPGYFRDPATGAEYILFTGNAPDAPAGPDGVIGAAVRRDDGWHLLPPILSAIGVNSEMERAHVVMHDGRYYLFWSTQRRRFASGIDAPTGLYGMVADRFEGPWRPANGTGLIAANPGDAPMQAYCWWVTGELEVASFVDYWRTTEGTAPDTAGERRREFGGTAAPFFRLAIDGDRVTPVA